MTGKQIESFDRRHEQALRNIWFLGDVHGEFGHVARALDQAREPASWLVFLGDVELVRAPLREMLLPLRRDRPNLRVAYIHGNHDADSYAHWEMLHDAGDAVALHGRVVELDGVRIAGLGGIFMGRVWKPPREPIFHSKAAAMNRGAYQYRDGQRPSPGYLAAIYWDEFGALASLQADILVTHEAPSCHPYGNAALDELAQRLGVKRSFHGHHHDDLSTEYAVARERLGFDAQAVGYCAIKNGLGEVIRQEEAA